MTSGGITSIRFRGPGPAENEIPNEERDVASAIAQRWKRNRKHVQPVEEVAAEPTLPDFVGEVTIRGSNDADVDIDRTRAAQTFDLPLLHDPQEPRLQLEWQFAHFVQKHRPSVGELEPADLGRIRSGERTPLSPEQLALDQRRR